MEHIDNNETNFQSFITALKLVAKKLQEIKLKEKKTIVFEEDDIFALNFIVKFVGDFIYLTDFEYNLVKDMLNKITTEEKAGKTDTATYLKMINFLIEENNKLKRENKRFKDNKKEIKKLIESVDE